MAAENKDIEKDIDIEEVKEDNTADEAVEEERLLLWILLMLKK